MNNSFSNYAKSAKYDLPASIVVFLVALPLCLGIALASEVDLFAGLISGIVGGIVVGFFSKSNLSVSGPAAGLVAIVLSSVSDLGGYEAFLTALVLAGVIQIVLGIIKAGIIGLYFPSSVIKGMLAAIGLILILKQIPHLVGFDQDAFGEMEFFQADGYNTLTEILNAFQHVYLGSLIVGLISLGLLILWMAPLVGKNVVLKAIPAGVLVVVMGVVVNQLFAIFSPELAIGPSHLVQIPVITSFESFQTIFKTPDFSALSNYNTYVTAVTLALIASLETLLSVEAVDKLDPHKGRTPKNEELKAQGIGNLICGLIGGLPITAVIVRSSANVDAGAKTKASAILHGIFLTVAVLLFPQVMNMIPYASLAAVLIVVGYKLNKPSLYKTMFHLGWDRFIPFIVTVLAILFTNLLVGILIGLGVGVFYLLRANHRVAFDYTQDQHEEHGHQVIEITLSEHVSFLNKASLQVRLDELPEGSEVIIDGTLCKDIDYDALELIHNFRDSAHENNITFIFKNVPELKQVMA